MDYRHTTISSPWAALTSSVFGFTFLPMAWLLLLLVPSGSLIGYQSIQVYHHHLLQVDAARSPESGQCSYSMCQCFLHFRGGRPLYKVQSLIFLILLEIPTARFMTSNPMVSPKILLDVLVLLRCIASLSL
jgi:hypothetical protein